MGGVGSRTPQAPSQPGRNKHHEVQGAGRCPPHPPEVQDDLTPNGLSGGPRVSWGAMSVQALKHAYATWTEFQSMPSPALKAALKAVMRAPSTDADDFFHAAVTAYRDGADGFWVDHAIRYAQSARDPVRAQAWLEAILLHDHPYRSLGALRSAAATTLGTLAAYPNAALAWTIHAAGEADGESGALCRHFLRAAAYGAYIMTATDFDTGLAAGRALEASGGEPTVRLAEAFIARHRGQAPEA